MKVIKRSGVEESFNSDKILQAVTKANNSVAENKRLDAIRIKAIVNDTEHMCYDRHRTPTVEEISDIVEELLMRADAYDVARNFIKYRYTHALLRHAHSTDSTILSLLSLNNEEIKQENSNKNPTLNSTQRDYMAGEVSKDLARRYLIPEHLMQAHDEGLIHIHDMDYIMNSEYNCCLINLEDMLENGTVISETLIERPHSFSTACTIATQIFAAVSSNQYGGQSFSLAHLCPFVNETRKRAIKDLEIILKDSHVSKEDFDKIIEAKVTADIEKGIQTIQYQLITLMTTNGQAPFNTMFIYLKEAKDEQTKKDMIRVVEEVFKQRIKGVKNEQGINITPAFPKIIYVLDDENFEEGTPYFFLTKLAAQCTAKRMVPDYISEKIMKNLKNGDVFPAMGCVEAQEVITYKYKGTLFVEGFERMYNRMLQDFPEKDQAIKTNKYIEVENLEIWDSGKQDFVKVVVVVKNLSSEWYRIKLSGGRILECTGDHPLPAKGRGRTFVGDLRIDDVIPIDGNQYSDETYNIDPDLAWWYGLLLCDGCYDKQLSISIAMNGEDEIVHKIESVLKKHISPEVNMRIKEWHRGKKGNYKEIKPDWNGRIEYSKTLESIFNGKQKIYRHIPEFIFRASREAKIAFMAGMIDADGYINSSKNHAYAKVQIGSTNKELALQQLLLAQSLGWYAQMYTNHYANNDKIRYRVEFIATEELIRYIVCNKKSSKIPLNGNTPDISRIEGKVNSIEKLDWENVYSYDVTTESDHFTVSGIYSHNCRSILSNWYDSMGNSKYYGRFNQGVVTINLPDVALSCIDKNQFWEVFDKRLNLCFEALMIRHKRLLGVTSDVAPILWQHGAISRLKQGEKIDHLLFGGYSTISLGYAGLAECVKYLTGKPLTSDEGKELGLRIMKYMNDAVSRWKKETNIGFAIYGTPLESVTYKFAKLNQKRHGIIKGVTDKSYITNSYHVPVTQEINAFDKLAFESQFQELSTGGAISYVEVPNMQNNIEAVLSIMKFIYNNIMYAELNTKSDYCQECGFDGEIQIVKDEDGKLIWECPKCGNRNQSKMNVARRTCGYIGTQFWNQGRTQEIKDRVLHCS